MRDRSDLIEQPLAQILVDLDERYGVLFGPEPAQMEGRDIDSGVAQGPAEIADEAGLVLVAHEQDIGSEFGLHRDSFDFDDARLVAAEQGAGDAGGPAGALDRDPDQR